MTLNFTLPALPLVPFRPVAQPASLPVQAAGFETLLSGSSGPAAQLPSLPVSSGDVISSSPQFRENAAAIVVAPEADVDAAMLPLLSAFGGDAATSAISALPHTRKGDQAVVSDGKSDAAGLTQRECAEMLVPVPVVPTPAIVLALSAATPASAPTLPAPTLATAAAVLPSVLAKANQAAKVAVPKDAPPVMEPDVEIGVRRDAVSVQALITRRNTAPTLPQPTQAAPLLVNQPAAAPVADSAALLASVLIDDNYAFGAGFQILMTDSIVDAAVRPLADSSVIVAERALDLARGSLWLDQLAGDIVAAQDSDRDLAFRLVPAQLGQLGVRIAMRDDGMQLNFRTQNDEAASIIGNAQSRLVDELKGQGVRVAWCEVNGGSGQPEASQHNGFSGQNGYPVRRDTIAEFERPAPDFPEPTNPNEPQNGRFA